MLALIGVLLFAAVVVLVAILVKDEDVKFAVGFFGALIAVTGFFSASAAGSSDFLIRHQLINYQVPSGHATEIFVDKSKSNKLEFVDGEGKTVFIPMNQVDFVFDGKNNVSCDHTIHKADYTVSYFSQTFTSDITCTVHLVKNGVTIQ